MGIPVKTPLGERTGKQVAQLMTCQIRLFGDKQGLDREPAEIRLVVSERIGPCEDLLEFDLCGTIVPFTTAFEDHLGASMSLVIQREKLAGTFETKANGEIIGVKWMRITPR